MRCVTCTGDRLLSDKTHVRTAPLSFCKSMAKKVFALGHV